MRLQAAFHLGHGPGVVRIGVRGRRQLAVRNRSPAQYFGHAAGTLPTWRSALSPRCATTCPHVPYQRITRAKDREHNRILDPPSDIQMVGDEPDDHGGDDYAHEHRYDVLNHPSPGCPLVKPIAHDDEYGISSAGAVAGFQGNRALGVPPGTDERAAPLSLPLTFAFPRVVLARVRRSRTGRRAGACGTAARQLPSGPGGRGARRVLAARRCSWSWRVAVPGCPCLSSRCRGRPTYAAAFGLGLAVQRAFIILPMRCSALALGWM
jgi:hypothetical protein